MLPLLRIPCILVATVGLHIAVMAPTPPPAEEERAPSTKLEIILGSPFLLRSIGKVGWAAAFIEIAVILASRTPPSPVSEAVLSNLIFVSGNAGLIQASPLFFVATFGAGLGGWIRKKCYQALGTLFTFQMSIRKDHRLITSGPYSVVRHPGYTGAFLAFMGALAAHGMEGSWIRESGALTNSFLGGIAVTTAALMCTVIVGLMQRMYKEDENLHRRYGEEWEVWAREVPYMLIPWLI